jgi:UDP-glucose 4-epimerase
MTMHCLVTGASGFIGSWLVRQLLREHHSVIAVLHKQEPAHDTADWFDRVRTVHADLENTPDLRQTLTGKTIDVVFHLAWWGVAAGHRNDPAQISTNLGASLRVCELAGDLGCRHFIGLGSQAEYGPCPGKFAEGSPLRPITAYGVAKLAAGMLTAKMAEMTQMRHTWVRLVAAYGPGDNPQHLIPAVIRTLLAGGKPALTAADQTCDYLYVEDAARALTRIATTGVTGTLNLASGETVVLRNLLERVRAMVDPHLPLGFGELPYRADQVMHLEADISRLRLSTGWQPEVSLEEGLRRTVAWARGEAAHALVP